MAYTGIPWSRTRLAATSSCVDRGFEAHSTTSAPPSRRQIARFAVSAVTCRQAEMRTPFRGWFLMNSLRIICSTFMDWFAHSMRFLPRSARSRFLMSPLTCAAVDMLLLGGALCAENSDYPTDEGNENVRLLTSLLAEYTNSGARSGYRNAPWVMRLPALAEV